MNARRIAVIGAGMAGAACARMLADAGRAVQVFDKSRGVGGRMATRRAEWVGADGQRQQASFDHGVPGFTVHAPEFLRFVEQAARDGLLARWLPRRAPGSYAPLDDPALWVATPDMSALCRALLSGIPLHTQRTVDELQRCADGWRLLSDGTTVGEGFDAVLVAIPPAQAARLLQAHQADWAQRAQALPMQPCWVLMGVTPDEGVAPDWDLAWPNDGPLAWVLRNEAKPGRQAVPGHVHWVLQATARWSLTHLEAPPAEVQAALQAAQAAWLGKPLQWAHAAVHRWRYASVPRAAGTPVAGRCAWDAALGLGWCGDALGGSGVEGAWTSGRALAAALIDPGGSGA